MDEKCMYVRSCLDILDITTSFLLLVWLISFHFGGLCHLKMRVRTSAQLGRDIDCNPREWTRLFTLIKYVYKNRPFEIFKTIYRLWFWETLYLFDTIQCRNKCRVSRTDLIAWIWVRWRGKGSISDGGLTAPSLPIDARRETPILRRTSSTYRFLSSLLFDWIQFLVYR